MQVTPFPVQKNIFTLENQNLVSPGGGKYIPLYARISSVAAVTTYCSMRRLDAAAGAAYTVPTGKVWRLFKVYYWIVATGVSGYLVGGYGDNDGGWNFTTAPTNNKTRGGVGYIVYTPAGYIAPLGATALVWVAQNWCLEVPAGKIPFSGFQSPGGGNFDVQCEFHGVEVDAAGV